MDLAGQAVSPSGNRLGPQPGYAMVALMVGMGIMAIMMTMAMPVWKQMAQREKEAELIFRGEQYARAIGLFARKSGPGTLPPNIDLLIDQRFLRKKYKDPITGDDFLPVVAGAPAGSAQPGVQPPAAQPGAAAGRGQASGPFGGRGQGAGAGAPGVARGGIQGVVSKSKERSLRLYKGRNYYHEWAFVYVPRVQAPAAGGDGRGGDGRGGRGQPPPGGVGGRGRGQPPIGPPGGGRGFPGAPPPPPAPGGRMLPFPPPPGN